MLGRVLMKKILLLNGPNLNLLGKREPEIYGTTTLFHIESKLSQLGEAHGVEVICRQSNHEGEIIDYLHDAYHFDGVILNAGAFTHYSYAIRDAIAAIKAPVIEVHISNIHSRETFRHVSVMAPETKGQIVGLGIKGYELAFYALLDDEGER
jgi:3-dehydroquinate dehydratase II